MSNIPKHFFYIPAMSNGTYAAAQQKDKKIGDSDITVRFFHEDMPEKYRYPYYLITAGHYFKKGFVLDKFGLDKSKNLIIGDSGGYQIASGAIKYSEDIMKQIFHWLEDNSNVAVNLDIPPRMKLEGKFQESMDLSNKHFKYFYENQTGKTNFLNVLQGQDKQSFQTWYNMASQYEFGGWAVGGIGGNINKLFEAIVLLLENKEHLKPNNKFLHILGTNRLLDFIILEQLQKSFSEVGSVTQVMSDSSSPSRQAAFGGYYTGFSWKTLSYTTVSLTNRTTYDNNTPLIQACDFDRDIIAPHVDMKTINEWGQDGYTAITMHNLYFLIDMYNKVKTVIHADPQLREQMFSHEVNIALKAIDEIVKSDNPRQAYNHHKVALNTINKYNSASGGVDTESLNTFFTTESN